MEYVQGKGIENKVNPYVLSQSQSLDTFEVSELLKYHFIQPTKGYPR